MRGSLLFAAPSVVLAAAFAGCSLVTSLDGFSNGEDPDGGILIAEGGSDADAAAPDAPRGGDGGACRGDAGSAMIAVGGFCVDATEVTKAAYAAFLASGASPAMPSYCAYRTSHVPSMEWPPPSSASQRPAAYIDWCDAYAYCSWTGKRLCGRIGGGAPLTMAESKNAVVNEWYSACSAGGALRYPYGDTLDPAACNGKGNGKGETLDVASKPTCAGGYARLFDMSGNVYEWLDGCVGTAGRDDPCPIAGGSFEGADTDLACEGLGYITRSNTFSDVGIRCCSGP